MALAKYYEDNLEIYNERMRDYSYSMSVSSVSVESEPKKETKSISRNRIILEQRICPCCGKEFSISLGEAIFFFKHDLNLPKKCKSCRAMAKASTKIPYGKRQKV